MLLRWLLDVIYPPKCTLCRRILAPNETDLCGDCRVQTESCHRKNIRLPFIEGWAAVWYYEDDVRRSLLRFKFHNARGYAACYGRQLAMKLQEEFPDSFDVLTWVPTGTLRRLRRGYDQVELLARATARELELPMVSCLKKIRNNPPQSGIKGDAHRRANVLGVYRARNLERFAGKRVLLLDDIITTGSTAGECARILLTAGAAEVYCGAVAFSRRDQKSSR